MGKTTRKAFGFFAAITLATLGLSPAVAAGKTSVFTDSEQTQLSLVACETATELDCVESFGFLDSKNTYVPARLTNTSKTPTYKDDNGNTIKSAVTEWAAEVDGVSKTATLDVPLQSRSYVIWKNPNGRDLLGSSLRPWISAPDLLKTKVRFVVRTSFLRPMNVQLVADDANFAQKKLANGNAWMFEGAGTAVSNYTHGFDQEDRRNFSAQADVDESTLHFIIHHADTDPTRGYWPPTCANVGYTVQAFNSNAAGDPYWDDAQQSLNFAVVSPHTKANGKQNTGFFRFWVSEAFLDCKFPTNKISAAASLTVQIVNEDGTPQAASILVTKKNGQIFIDAAGFHYSKPTIKVKPSGAKAPGVRKTITCISAKNSKVQKKVTGVNPKCPSGFKLRR